MTSTLVRSVLQAQMQLRALLLASDLLPMRLFHFVTRRTTAAPNHERHHAVRQAQVTRRYCNASVR